MEMANFLASMNGFFLQRNLMACGKGMFAGFDFLDRLKLIDVK